MSIDLFHIIDDVQVIIYKDGVYTQVEVFERDSSVYAAKGRGFIRLLAGGRTTYPRATWLQLGSHHKINPGDNLVAPSIKQGLRICG